MKFTRQKPKTGHPSPRCDAFTSKLDSAEVLEYIYKVDLLEGLFIESCSLLLTYVITLTCSSPLNNWCSYEKRLLSPAVCFAWFVVSLNTLQDSQLRSSPPAGLNNYCNLWFSDFNASYFYSSKQPASDRNYSIRRHTLVLLSVLSSV